MRNLLILAVFTASILFTFTDVSYSACNETEPNMYVCDAQPPNPDPDGVQQEFNNNPITVHVLPDGNIDTGNFAALNLGEGDNTIDIDSATLEASGRAVLSRSGNDIANVYNSVLRSNGGFTFSLSTGNDTATVEKSTIAGTTNFIINMSSGVDNLTVKNSTVTNEGNGNTISMGDGEDKILIVNSTITNGSGILPVRGGTEDDEITLGGFGSDIPGGIDCGFLNDDDSLDDTLIFALEVPQNQIAELTEEINNLPSGAGSITINGFLYEYIRCENIIADLRTPVGKPIPTLSEWGLIAMAGLIGIAGLIFHRRRAIA